jgi:hypothetical protein
VHRSVVSKLFRQFFHRVELLLHRVPFRSHLAWMAAVFLLRNGRTDVVLDICIASLTFKKLVGKQQGVIPTLTISNWIMMGRQWKRIIIETTSIMKNVNMKRRIYLLPCYRFSKVNNKSRTLYTHCDTQRLQTIRSLSCEIYAPSLYLNRCLSSSSCCPLIQLLFLPLCHIDTRHIIGILRRSITGEDKQQLHDNMCWFSHGKLTALQEEMIKRP